MLVLDDEGVIPCPRLTPEKLCSVYDERYKEGSADLVVVGYWKSRRFKTLEGEPATRPFWCGRVKDLAHTLPIEVAERCCVIHPEVLTDENISNT